MGKNRGWRRSAGAWLSLFAAGLMVASGCSHSPVVYPAAPPIYYGVSFETARSTTGGVVPRRSDVLAKDARTLLKLGQTVAFLPPDSCITTSVAPSGASQGSNAILMECGALLASLEAEVAKAGYSVVSWQAIKAAGSVASQERAKSLGVNVLFEVNQLSPATRVAGALKVSNLRFSREDGPDQAVPMAVSSVVANRCARQITGLHRSRVKDVEYLSTVNLKAVDVSSGRALWLYQNTVVEVTGENATKQRTLNFRADGIRPLPPSVEPSALSIVGTVGVVFGSIALLVAGTLAAVKKGEPGKVAVGGTLGVAASVGMMMLGHKLSTPDRTVPPATYPDKDQVLCVTAPDLNPWGRLDTSPGAPPTEHESYTMTQSADADRDLSQERAERLTRKTTEDFVGALQDVAGR
jgi:hypothetical protein